MANFPAYPQGRTRSRCSIWGLLRRCKIGGQCTRGLRLHWSCWGRFWCSKVWWTGCEGDGDWRGIVFGIFCCFLLNCMRGYILLMSNIYYQYRHSTSYRYPCISKSRFHAAKLRSSACIYLDHLGMNVRTLNRDRFEDIFSKDYL